jgi:hypothetical protein
MILTMKKNPHKRIWSPMIGFIPKPHPVYTNSRIVRQNEYLIAMGELTGSNEGMELESLSNTCEQNMENVQYDEYELEYN